MTLDFSSIPQSSWLGRSLRRLLRVVPRGLVVPVVQGPMRGARWVVGAGNHGYWLGTYELDLQRLLSEQLSAGAVLWDVGAHVGFFTVLGARLVGPSGHVLAFEPLPRNAGLLERHVRLNRLEERVRFFPAAVGDFEGSGAFIETADSSMGRLEPGGNLAVPVVTLDGVLSRGGPAPSLVKVDVENSELAVLRGSEALVRRVRPVFLVSVHNDELRAGCSAWLTGHGYRVRPAEGRRGIDEGMLHASSATT